MDWLTDRTSFLLAVGFYALSTLHALFLWRKGFQRDDRVTYLLMAAAFLLHTLAMVKRGFSLSRCPVNNLYEAMVFVSWTIVTAYLVLGLWRKLRFVGAFASPILLGIGVFALMPSLDAHRGPNPDFRTDWGSLHAALVLLSCGAFGLGSVSGFMYLSQEHDLRYRRTRAILSVLPPIDRLERLTTALLLGGFVLLTAGLSLSPLLLRQKYGVLMKPDPMLLYSVFIWTLYLGLLSMRWKLGHGGRRLAWGAVGSFAFLLLTFWGFILLSPAHTP